MTIIRMCIVLEDEEFLVGACSEEHARLLQSHSLAQGAVGKLTLRNPKKDDERSFEELDLQLTPEESERWQRDPPVWMGVPRDCQINPIYDEIFNRDPNWQDMLGGEPEEFRTIILDLCGL